MSVRIGIVGGAGRMGLALVRRTLELQRRDGSCSLVGVLVRDGSPALGRDAGLLAGGDPCGVATSTDPVALFADADAVIDFTTPEATGRFAVLAAQGKTVHVVGTTGLGPAEDRALDAASHHAPIIRAANMSLGVTLLQALVEKVAATLDDGFDIEIVEMHHRHKVDAPSGTALMLGGAAARARGMSLADAAQHGRSGITGARASGMIGFHAIRGGDVIGDHDVVFAGPGERVVLRHLATDRAVFARGALRAALWAQGRAAGEYTMADVLGLER